MNIMRIGRGERAAAVLLLLAASCLGPGEAGRAPTVDEAKKFLDEAEQRILQLAVESSRADWVHSTYITDDTELLAAAANRRSIESTIDLAKRAVRFERLQLPEDMVRKLKLIKLSLTLPTPADPAGSEELTRTVAAMEGTYGKGKYCPGAGECLDINQLGRILATARDPRKLEEVWVGWHRIAPPIRRPYGRYVELVNKGARELGFADAGAMWRSKYDMTPEAFEREVERLWRQVQPLYHALHAYVRSRLRKHYGPSAVPERGPIPAHLLGNMWAQQWGNIYPLVAPKESDPGYDLTERLKAKKVDERAMVRYGERFFTSLGFDPLPKSFWERSLLVKPREREVVCHASAWDVDMENDLRIKMCIEITAEDFDTIHHELGHNFYQRAYNRQPVLFRDSANDGFHEAVGDTIALSVTPAYLVEVGLLEREPDPSKDIGLLLQMALDKVAFLPFGLLIDQWRWNVFAGETPPERYNQAWWDLRLKYQGVAAPVERSESDFDPGAKYHVPANVPYTRYFLAHILQFQLHRALLEAAGYQGPLHRGSIYGNGEAGRRLRAMLEMGQSRPWPDALEAVTGKREMDATAILDYFAPLRAWLDEQNKGVPVGW